MFLTPQTKLYIGKNNSSSYSNQTFFIDELEIWESIMTEYYIQKAYGNLIDLKNGTTRIQKKRACPTKISTFSNVIFPESGSSSDTTEEFTVNFNQVYEGDLFSGSHKTPLVTGTANQIPGMYSWAAELFPDSTLHLGWLKILRH